MLPLLMFGLLGMQSMIFGQGRDGQPAPIYQIVVGLAVSMTLILCMLAVAKGYRLTVARDRVVAHGIVNKVFPYGAIESVEVVRAMCRWAQMRTCLRFHLVDGSSYTFKNFNGSLVVGSKSEAQVVRAKELIDMRIAELRCPGALRIPPPPPPPAPKATATDP
jgi:hypothetical protein